MVRQKLMEFTSNKMMFCKEFLSKYLEILYQNNLLKIIIIIKVGTNLFCAEQMNDFVWKILLNKALCHIGNISAI